MLLNKATLLFASGVKIGTFLTKRFSTVSLSDVLGFDVVSGVTFSVVVMNRLLNGMPWRLFRHNVSPPFVSHEITSVISSKLTKMQHSIFAGKIRNKIQYFGIKAPIWL